MPDFGDSTQYGQADGGRYQYEGQRDPNDVSLSPEAYAEYQHKRKIAQILGLLGVFGGASALGAVGGALGGGGGAASGSLGTIAGGSPWEVTPYVGTAAMNAPGAMGGVAAGVGAGAGAGATGGAAKGVLGGLSARDLAALGLTGASVVGSALSDKPNMAPNTQTTDPNLVKLLQSMQGRLDQSEPLYKSIMAMANGLLPTQYQNGGAGR